MEATANFSMFCMCCVRVCENMREWGLCVCRTHCTWALRPNISHQALPPSVWSCSLIPRCSQISWLYSHYFSFLRGNIINQSSIVSKYQKSMMLLSWPEKTDQEIPCFITSQTSVLFSTAAITLTWSWKYLAVTWIGYYSEKRRIQWTAYDS